MIRGVIEVRHIMYKTLSDPVKAIVFYAIAFGLEFVAAVALAPLLGELAVLVGMFTPTIATLVMLLLVTREGYTRAGWASLGLHRTGLRAWGLALLAPLLVLGGAYGVLWASGVASAALPAGLNGAALIQLALKTLIMIGIGVFSGALGEELGWRGYLLPKLLFLGPRRALLLSGLLHGIWHLPMILLTPYYHSMGNLLITLPLFLATFTLAGVFYGWLRLTTGSVWPAAIAHRAINLFWAGFAAITVTTSPLLVEYLAGEAGLLTLIGIAIVAAVLLAQLEASSRRQLRSVRL
jgi:membrane protease YdiL (CAAX protease family)